MEGGADTGFHHVEPEKYTPRLMHFSGTGVNVVVREVRFFFSAKTIMDNLRELCGAPDNSDVKIC